MAQSSKRAAEHDSHKYDGIMDNELPQHKERCEREKEQLTAEIRTLKETTKTRIGLIKERTKEQQTAEIRRLTETTRTKIGLIEERKNKLDVKIKAYTREIKIRKQAQAKAERLARKQRERDSNAAEAEAKRRRIDIIKEQHEERIADINRKHEEQMAKIRRESGGGGNPSHPVNAVLNDLGMLEQLSI